MPNISASDYTTYLKYKAAAQAYTSGNAPRQIQTVDQVSPNVNIINSYLKTSQAAYVVNAAQTNLSGLNYVRAPPPNNVNHPEAKSTVSWTSGTSGSVSSTTSSKFQQPGGLPAKNVVGTYARLPQNAGWYNGRTAQATSSAIRNNQVPIPSTIL